MCVPGVQACATDGVRTSSSNAASKTLPAETARGEARDIPRALDADALTLTANCFPEIVQLVFHDVVDCIASGVHIVADLLYNVVNRDAVNHLTTTLDRASEAALGARASPPCSFDGTVASPSRSLEPASACPLCAFESGKSSQRGTATGVAHQRRHWTPARRASSQQQCDPCSDSSSDESGRQQVILLLALLVELSLWV